MNMAVGVIPETFRIHFTPYAYKTQGIAPIGVITGEEVHQRLIVRGRAVIVKPHRRAPVHPGIGIRHTGMFTALIAWNHIFFRTPLPGKPAEMRQPRLPAGHQLFTHTFQNFPGQSDSGMNKAIARFRQNFHFIRNRGYIVFGTEPIRRE